MRLLAKPNVIEGHIGRDAAFVVEETAATTVQLEGGADGQEHETEPRSLLAAGSIDTAAISFAIAAGTRISDQQAREIIIAARARLNANEEARGSRKDTTPSESTLSNYRKKCAVLDAAVRVTDKSPADALRSSLGKYAGARQSFQAMKSAVRTLTLARIKLLLGQQDKLQRLRATAKESEWKPKWLALVSMLRWGLSNLEVVDNLNRDECLIAEGLVAKPSRSKRKALPRLDSGWRERFLQRNDKSVTYREAGVVLRYAGVRPIELESGVRLRWTKRGIWVGVEGAKVRATAGQPWRSFLLDAGQLPEWFVDRVRANRRMVVDGKADAMRTHLHRQTRPVLNPTGSKRIEDMRLSAYMFRHALVSDLRAAGWTPEDIAPVIGESSARTANLYGTAHTTGTVMPAIVAGSVRVPRAVKPLDRSGLPNVVGKGKKPKGAR